MSKSANFLDRSKKVEIPNLRKLDTLYEQHQYRDIFKHSDESLFKFGLISRTTLRTLRIIIGIGNFMKIFPWNWNQEKKIFSSSDAMNPGRWKLRWSWVAWLNVLLNLILMLSISMSLAVPNVKTSVIMMVIAMDSVGVGAIIFHLINVFLWREMEHLLNSILVFSQREALRSKTITVNQGKPMKDGLETFCKLLLSSGGFIQLMLGPAIVLSIHFRLNIASVWVYIVDSTSPSWVGYLWLTSLILYLAFMNTTVIFEGIFTLLLIINVFIVWLKLNFWTQDLSLADLKSMSEIRIQCRSHQILHRCAFDIVYSVVPVITLTAIVCMVGSLYTIIHSHSEINKFTITFLTSVFLITSFSCGFGVRLGNQVAELSIGYSDSFLNSPALDESGQLFFKSYRPLNWQIGPFVRFSKSTFVVIMSDIVIDAVVTLLLS